jgi:hypothetical protein
MLDEKAKLEEEETTQIQLIVLSPSKLINQFNKTTKQSKWEKRRDQTRKRELRYSRLSVVNATP